MKKILLSICILISIRAFSQDTNDSAYIKNLPLQARLIAYLAPKTLDPTNDSLYSVFIKWRASLRANPVTGTATVSIDTIPAVELANMYDFVLGNPDGYGAGALMKSQLNSARAAHAYLDRLCTGIENKYAAQLTNAQLIGRKLFLGK